MNDPTRNPLTEDAIQWQAHKDMAARLSHIATELYGLNSTSLRPLNLIAYEIDAAVRAELDAAVVVWKRLQKNA